MSLLDLEDRIDKTITAENVLALDGWNYSGDYSGARGIYITKKLVIPGHNSYSLTFGNCTGHIVLNYTNHICRFVHNSVLVHNKLSGGGYKCICWTKVNTISDLFAFEALIENELKSIS